MQHTRMARAFDLDGGHEEPILEPSRPPAHKVFRRQKQSQWCWAACIEMLRAQLGLEKLAQCAIANDWLGRGDCCGAGSDGPACNRPCPLEQVEALCRRNGIECDARDGPLSESDLKLEIGDSPVLLAWLWDDGQSAHVVLALWDHVEVEGGPSRVMLADPGKSGAAVVDYHELRSSRRGGGAWVRTWHRMRRGADAQS